MQFFFKIYVILYMYIFLWREMVDLILMLSVDIVACVAIYFCIESYNAREKSERLCFDFSNECELCPSTDTQIYIW